MTVSYPTLRRIVGTVVAVAVVTSPAWVRTAPAAEPANPPATQPASPPTTSVRPDDLRPATGNAVIAPGDLLRVSIWDLTGPHTEMVKTTRVGPGGAIFLPYVDEVKVGGLTEGEAQKAVENAYRSGNLLARAPISISVLESARRAFSVVGSAGKPGVFPLSRPDFRLLDAMALAEVSAEGGRLLVLRYEPTGRDADKDAEHAAPQPRLIEVDVARLLDGDAGQNLVIRPGDTVIARSPSRRSLRTSAFGDRSARDDRDRPARSPTPPQVPPQRNPSEP